MIWWLKARGVPLTAGGTLAVFLFAAAVRQESIPMPSLVGSTGGILVVQLLGLLPAFLLLHGMERGDSATEEVAVRPVRWRNLVLCTGFACALSVGAIVVHLVLDRPEMLSLARNSVGFLAVALIIRAFLGSGIAVVAVAALPLACAVAGRRADGTPRPWAWPVQEPLSALATAEVFVLFLAGCGLLLWRTRPLRDLI